MTAVYVSMAVIILLALAVLGVVAVGMRGMYSERAPRLANGFAEAARHMNGDAEAPQKLVDMLPSGLGRQLVEQQH